MQTALIIRTSLILSLTAIVASCGGSNIAPDWTGNVASVPSKTAAFSEVVNRRMLSDLEDVASSTCEWKKAPCFKIPVEAERTMIAVDGQSANAIKSVVFPNAQVCDVPVERLDRVEDAHFNMPSLCVQRYFHRLVVSAHTDTVLPNLSDAHFDRVSPDFRERYREYDLSLWNMQSANSRRAECEGYCWTGQVRRRDEIIAEILFVQVEQ